MLPCQQRKAQASLRVKQSSLQEKGWQFMESTIELTGRAASLVKAEFENARTAKFGSEQVHFQLRFQTQQWS